MLTVCTSSGPYSLSQDKQLTSCGDVSRWPQGGCGEDFPSPTRLRRGGGHRNGLILESGSGDSEGHSGCLAGITGKWWLWKESLIASDYGETPGASGAELRA